VDRVQGLPFNSSAWISCYPTPFEGRVAAAAAAVAQDDGEPGDRDDGEEDVEAGHGWEMGVDGKQQQLASQTCRHIRGNKVHITHITRTTWTEERKQSGGG
jgi:hypothetical protein